MKRVRTTSAATLIGLAIVVIFLVAGVPTAPTLSSAGPPHVPQAPVGTFGAVRAIKSVEASPPLSLEIDRQGSPRSASLPSLIHSWSYATGESEPIATGIGDFGLTPTLSPYEYTTTTFRGSAVIDSLTDGVLRSQPEVSFQLNLNLVFSNGSRTMIFWVQNVPFADTKKATTQTVQMVDNVWNQSSTGFPPTTAVGNGSVEGDQAYIYSVPQGPGELPGLGVALPDPLTLEAQTISSTADGTPYVLMQYNDGAGWQTYDNISFPWAHGWTDDNFVVDGFQTGPYGNPIDADWTIDGPGGGTVATDVSSNVTLNLQYWNGDNFQAVTNAFNFGFTGEASDNAISMAALNASSGIPGASFVAGPGIPGPLYGPDQVAILNVSSAAPNGTVYLNGQPTPYRGGEANLTVHAGSYFIQLYGQNSDWVGDANVTLSPGEYFPLNLAWRQVIFTETGLPNGTNWSVNIDGATDWSTNASIDVHLPIGEFDYSVDQIDGFTSDNASGDLRVTEAGATRSILWTPQSYAVSVRSMGLPGSVGWSIILQGRTYTSGTNATISVFLSNGTYEYQVTDVSFGFVTLAPIGNLTVSGSPVVLMLPFAPRDGVLFGWVSPTDASVWLNGSPIELVQGNFLRPVAPGEYQLVARASGYLPYVLNITITPANSTGLPIALTSSSTKSVPPSGAAPSGTSSDVVPLLLGSAAIAVLGIMFCLSFIFENRRSRGGPPPRAPPKRMPVN
ncbi:MAG: thermopsin [Thermoplasmata archaeon]|nr:thermopsin [Thermoplasmata archaeon]